jgi:hypothetical protein
MDEDIDFLMYDFAIFEENVRKSIKPLGMMNWLYTERQMKNTRFKTRLKNQSV